MRVPKGVFPEGTVDESIGAYLWEVKPSDYGFGYNRACLYSEYDTLKDKVANGNVMMSLPGQQPFMILRGMKKFGEENDDANKFFKKTRDQCKQLIFTKKEDGEVFHVSTFHMNGQFYVCSGTRYVHILTKGPEDVHLYEPYSPKTKRAMEITSLFWELVAKINEKDLFFNFLNHTKTTAVFSFVAHEGQKCIVGNRDTLEPTLKFIGWTAMYEKGNDDYFGIPSQTGFEIAKECGFEVVEYTCVREYDILGTKTDLEKTYCDRMDDIANRVHEEGEVVRFCDKNGEIFGMAIKRTSWYTCMKAIYQTLCSRNIGNRNLKESFTLNINTSLKMHGFANDREIWSAVWKPLTAQFHHWINNTRPSYRDCRYDFCTLWTTFLEDTGMADTYKSVEKFKRVANTWSYLDYELD
jgi:hypothetical protein